MEVEEKKNAETGDELKGRAAALARYKVRYPEIEDEPDDDALYDDEYSAQAKALADSEGRYGELAEKNQSLADMLSSDSRKAVFLSLIVSGKSIPYSLAKVYGKSLLEELVEGDADEIEKGNAEFLEEEKRRRGLEEKRLENFERYDSVLEEAVADGKLSDEEKNALHEYILQLETRVPFYDYDKDMLAGFVKSIRYDSAVEAGRLSGRNEQIKEMKKTLEGNGVPNLREKTGHGKTEPVTIEKPNKDWFTASNKRI
ncbi:MAG: hypothetical protein LBJ17_05415 [Dysgonamonadaceae bacterium]|jgi:hypothetical protein|nr:hypothetical protein [Dysgonamonadaceae bacterium]